MALSYINNKEIKFGSSKPLNGVYTPGSPTREYEPLDSLGIYLNSGIPLSYGVENGRYMSMSDEFAATSQGNSYSFNQLFAAQMMLGFKLHDRFIACDTEHKIIGTEPLLHKAYLAEITEKTLDYFKIKIYEEKTRTFCIRMSSSEVPTSYVDLTNSFDENGLNLTQTDRLSFLSYYRFYPLTVRALSTRVVETLGKGCYFLPSSESLRELSGDILSKFNAFISSGGGTLTSLGDTTFAYIGDVVYAVNYGGKITESLLDTKVNYSDALTYEEIMATTDLTNKVASASVLKSLSDNLNGFSILKSTYSNYRSWNIDDLDSYPKGEGILYYDLFSSSATGTKPFVDGHLLTFIWRNTGAGADILNQIAVEDDKTIIKMRKYSSNAWSDWKSVTIS